MHNVLRNLILHVQFDQDDSIDTPLGDFFGSAPGINPYSNFPMTVDADGTMTCRFVMPFKKTAQFSIENRGPQIHVVLNAPRSSPFPGA